MACFQQALWFGIVVVVVVVALIVAAVVVLIAVLAHRSSRQRYPRYFELDPDDDYDDEPGKYYGDHDDHVTR